MRFGISTHLYHDVRLDRAHLAEVARYGFEAIELFATRSHFDYRDASAIQQLKRWLGDTGLALHGIHAPITDRIQGGRWGAATYSTAAADTAERQIAIREIEAALQIVRDIPVDVIVVHLGTPSAMNRPGDNSPAAAARSIDEICGLAEPLGVRVAFEVIPNDLSTPDSIVAMLEHGGDARHAGICLDFGHAFLMGDVPDAVETAAEHLFTTHVHDNHGRADDHLPPYTGSIDWDRALMSMQKIGYDGTYLFEVAAGGSTTAPVLEETRRARQRFERTFAHP